jgi:hypothetical protein
MIALQAAGMIALITGVILVARAPILANLRPAALPHPTLPHPQLPHPSLPHLTLPHPTLPPALASAPAISPSQEL